MDFKKITRILEFIIVGVIFGLVEDLLAIYFATDSKINHEVVFIVFLIAVPFAFINEFIVDHPDFWKIIFFRNRKSDRSTQ